MERNTPEIGEKCQHRAPTTTQHFSLCVTMQILNKQSYMQRGQEEAGKLGDRSELVWAEERLPG